MNFTQSNPDTIALGTGAISTITNEFTVTAWVRFVSPHAGIAQGILVLANSASPYEGIDMYIRASTGAIGTYHSLIGSEVWSSKTVTSDVWQHVAIKGNAAGGTSGNVAASLNGDAWTTFLSSANTSAMVPKAGQPHYIGSWGLSTNYAFGGNIADVRFYDRQLNDNEIATIYSTRGVDNIVNGLKGRWLINQDPIGIVPVTVKDIGPDGVNSTSIVGTPISVETTLVV